MTNNSVNSTLQTALLIVLLLVSVLLLLYAADRFNLYSMGGTHVITTTEYVPAVEYSCEDYDIPQEYRNAYGHATIDATVTGCLNIGGIHTETDSELSCFWNPAAFFVDCTLPAQIEFGRFCRDELKGTYECDPDVAYLGCHCNRFVPAEWVPQAEDDEQDQEPDEEEDSNGDGVIETACYNVELPMYGDLGGLCRDNGLYCSSEATCEHFWSYNEKIHRCACSDTFFCGQYCYEYLYTNLCECPIGSTYEIVTRSTFQCVPNGCICDGNDVIC